MVRSGSSAFAMCVSGVVRVRLVRKGAPLGLLGPLFLSGSSRFVQGVAGFLRVRLVRSSAPWVSLGSY